MIDDLMYTYSMHACYPSRHSASFCWCLVTLLAAECSPHIKVPANIKTLWLPTRYNWGLTFFKISQKILQFWTNISKRNVLWIITWNISWTRWLVSKKFVRKLIFIEQRQHERCDRGWNGLAVCLVCKGLYGRWVSLAVYRQTDITYTPTCPQLTHAIGRLTDTNVAAQLWTNSYQAAIWNFSNYLQRW